MIVRPAKRIRGSLRMPGDKSISHRAAMIAALANGVSRIKNYANSTDCAATLSCLQQLGVRIDQTENDLVIHGVGIDGLRAPTDAMDCGNSGTTMRLLSGILAGQNFVSTLTGDESLCSRPMQRIIEPLEAMGAQISAKDGRAPLTIYGSSDLKAIDYELLIASAQVKSCILLAGLHAEGKTTVIENEVTRDHTERMLDFFGVSIETGKAEREPENARLAAVRGRAQLRARDVSIPGDISSAAYFIAAATLLRGSSLEINEVGANPTRIIFVERLRTLGFDVLTTNISEESNEPRGDIRVSSLEAPSRGHYQSPFMIQGSQIPQLIDELPLLVVVGSQIQGGIEIRDAKELRVKESDRIAATVAGLRAMGAKVEEFVDGLRVAGPIRLTGATIDARGDHRIVMAFSIAALIADGETEITDADCVGVSFPEFFDLLDSAVER